MTFKITNNISTEKTINVAKSEEKIPPMTCVFAIEPKNNHTFQSTYLNK